MGKRAAADGAMRDCVSDRGREAEEGWIEERVGLVDEERLFDRPKAARDLEVESLRCC